MKKNNAYKIGIFIFLLSLCMCNITSYASEIDGDSSLSSVVMDENTEESTDTTESSDTTETSQSAETTGTDTDLSFDISEYYERDAYKKYLEDVAPVEESDITGLLGNDIPEGVPRTYIQVKGIMEEHLNDVVDNGVPASIILLNIDNDIRYNIYLYKTNDWTLTTSIPSGRYIIENAYIGDGYFPKWNERFSEGVDFIEDDIVMINVGFGDVKLEDDRSEMEKIKDAQKGITYDFNKKEEPVKVDKDVKEETEKKKENIPLAIIVKVIGAIFLAVVGWAFYRIFIKQRDDEE